jgi:hypothetical protein
MRNEIPRPRVFIYRNGTELTDHPANGRAVAGFGSPAGTIGKAICFDSVTVIDGHNRRFEQSDFGGPVSLKVWSHGTKPLWFGLANAKTVALLNAQSVKA